MAERTPRPSRAADALTAFGLAAATATAFAATAAFRRFRKAQRGLAPDSEFTIGRGVPAGPVNVLSRRAGYEIRDVNVRILAVVMVVSVAIIVGGVAAVYAIYGSFDKHFQAPNGGLSALQKQAIDPPLPHLQAEPYREIDTTLMQQHQRLETYGWDDSDHTKAHIPIVQAMSRLVGRSLDTSVQATSGQAPQTSIRIPSAPPQRKPAYNAQGEGNPEQIPPSYNPDKTKEKP